MRGGQQAVSGSHSITIPGSDQNEAVDFFFRSRGLGSLCTQLELSFSASKLRDLDILSKSDPMAVTYLKNREGILEELGRTEVLTNTLDPIWIVKVSISYQFEMVQTLVFQIYDIDTRYYNVPVKMLNLNEQEFLGEATCTLSEIVTKQSRSLTLNLQDINGYRGMRNLGTLTVHAEETIASRKVVEMIFRCSDLKDMDLFSKSDPFLRISTVTESGGSIPIYKTEVVNNNLNPVWKSVHLTMQQYGSKDNPLIIECYDFNSNGKHALIGNLQKTLTDLEKVHEEKIGVNLYSASSSGRESKKVLRGQLFVEKFCEKLQYSFLDYIVGGFELNFMVAIDFTASNGNPQVSDSLHYIDPSGGLNSYQQAILEVGEVIQFYDYDRRFAAWGFGGRPIDGPVSHCFNLNGNAHECEVVGVEGIMSAYASTLNNVVLAGPTLFGPVINKAAKIASHSLSLNQSKYFVLLIITDGVITDLQETKDVIVKASDLPLSILIVGVGCADFKEMKSLDADDGERLESSTGRIATLDIVQFIPMQEVHHRGGISIVQSLFEELPGQFLTYMRSRDIKPPFTSP